MAYIELGHEKWFWTAPNWQGVCNGFGGSYEFGGPCEIEQRPARAWSHEKITNCSDLFASLFEPWPGGGDPSCAPFQGHDSLCVASCLLFNQCRSLSRTQSCVLSHTMQQSLTKKAAQSRTKPSIQCMSIVLSIPIHHPAQSIQALSSLRGPEYFSPSAIVPYSLQINIYNIQVKSRDQ